MTPKTLTLALLVAGSVCSLPCTAQDLSSARSSSGPLTAQPVAGAAKAAIDRDSLQHYYQKGIAERDKGSRLRSLNYFEKAHAFDPTDRPVINELALAYTDLRKYQQARDAYKKLVDLGDAPNEAYHHLVDLSFNLKQPEDVIQYANQLKKKDPSARVDYYLGKVLYEQENYGEAIRVLNQAAKEEPSKGEIPYMIARSYADMLNYKQSIPYFQKAIGLDTAKNNWMYELGLIYYAIHADRDALKYILMAGEHGYRKDNEYHENLGIAYLNAGELEQGVTILEELLKRRPSDLNLLNMVAEAYYGKGKFPQAITYWDRVLEYDKENASALYMIGMCYQKKGEKEKGQLLCDKAIEMDPSLGNLKQKKQITGL